MQFYTYILYSTIFDRYYVGHCEDMLARLSRHNGKMVPSTKAYVPWQLMYTESFSTRAEASAREHEIKKKKSRKYVELLIKGGQTRPDQHRGSPQRECPDTNRDPGYTFKQRKLLF